jgi:NAD(P)-dependent dehydrogenase (short-subunit alcohol dehydrogenase family)
MTASGQTDPRTVVITGATAGIGRALAERLAAAGVTVAIVARDAARGEAAQAEIAAASGNDRVELFPGDLSSMASVRDSARAVAEAHPAIDVLVHCAAVYTARRSVTVDGHETMLATNVLAPFLLTNLLLGQLRAARSARVIVLAAPSTTKLDFDDLQAERRFRSLTVFGASKAADLLFTFELARRLKDTSVTANAVHPGLARTSLMRQAVAPLRWMIRPMSASPQRAAAAIAPLALSPEFERLTGRFFHAGHEIDAPPYTRDPQVARRLWDVAAALTDLVEAQQPG